MKCERKEVLEKFLCSELLKEKSSLKESDLQQIKFTEDSGNLLIEALKKMVLSYCNDESDIQIIRSINSKIQS